MITERLYYNDAYSTRFTARVIDASDPLRVYLDRTAFYPHSGGQPNDFGTLNTSRVLDVLDEGARIAHLLDTPLSSTEVAGSIDWARRFDHMQQHSGQHLLSAILAEEFHAPTVSFHLGAEFCTIDVSTRSPLDLRAIEARVNQAVYDNRPISVAYEDSASTTGLRKESDREGVLRIVSIQDLDRSACGGTHVRTTAEIGPVILRRTEKIRTEIRIEFLCGLRAIRRLRADLDSANSQLATSAERLAAAEKARRKAAVELARFQGRDAWQAAPRLRRDGPIDDETRAFAQAFTANPGAVFLQVCSDPPSFFVAVSPDTGLDAGALTKSLVNTHGGRGGGSRQSAQGGLPDRATLDVLLPTLSALLGLQ